MALLTRIDVNGRRTVEHGAALNVLSRIHVIGGLRQNWIQSYTDHETLQHHVPGGQGSPIFGSPNVLDAKVTGRCMHEHQHHEFIRFVNTVEAAMPAGNLIHEVTDNYATCKHPKVRQWRAPSAPDIPFYPHLRA